MFLEKPVSVNVKFGPIEDVYRDGLWIPNPAWVIPTMIAATKDGGEILRYPQSLLRQFINTLEGKVDMTIRFNSNVNWNLVDNSTYSVTNNPNKYDFELWASREIVRGLGFMSGLVFRKSSRNVPFFTPEIEIIQHDNEYMTGFKPLYAFDSLATQYSKPFSSIFSNVSRLSRKRNIDGLQYLQGIEADLNLLRQAIRDSSRILVKPTRMQISSQPLLILGKTESVDSLVNFDVIRKDQPKEFLLFEDLKQVGVSLQVEMRKARTDNVIGPKMLSVFQRMGYSLVGNVSTATFEMVLPENDLQQDLSDKDLVSMEYESISTENALEDEESLSKVPETQTSSHTTPTIFNKMAKINEEIEPEITQSSAETTQQHSSIESRTIQNSNRMKRPAMTTEIQLEPKHFSNDREIAIQQLLNLKNMPTTPTPTNTLTTMTSSPPATMQFESDALYERVGKRPRIPTFDEIAAQGILNLRNQE